jgi:transcriptional regulator with XRE-family HTH domain
MVLEMSRQQWSGDDAKAAFGRKLKAALDAKSWNQSDLAKASGLGRDSVSTYIRGLTMPDAKNIKKLADALGVTPQDLTGGSAPERTSPALEITQSTAGKVFIRINQAVSFDQASRIMAILQEGGAE